MSSPLLLLRLRTEYPSGVTVQNITDVVVDVCTHTMKYNKAIDQSSLGKDVLSIIDQLECGMENWFVVYMIHSICDVLIRVRDNRIKLRSHSKWNCLCS